MSGAASVLGAIAGTAAGGPGVGTAVGAAVGGMIGPSYTPGGGGEIRRGLAADGWPTWRLETYIKWLSLYYPDVYNGKPGVSMWDLPGIGSPGQWNGALSRAILETNANGERIRNEGGNWTLDKNGNPVGGGVSNPAASEGGSGTRNQQVDTGSDVSRMWGAVKQWFVDNTLLGLGIAAAAVWLVWYAFFRKKRKARRRSRRKGTRTRRTSSTSMPL